MLQNQDTFKTPGVAHREVNGNMRTKEFAKLTDDELHDTMMDSLPGSNYFEWAKAELQHRDRRRMSGMMASSTKDVDIDPAKSANIEIMLVQKDRFHQL